MTKPPPFTYSRVTSAADAVAALRDHGEEAKLIAGGQSLMPLLALRFAMPAHLVDVNDLDECAYVRDEDGGLRIGGLTRHAELERAGLDGPWRAFSEAVPLIGHHPIRTRGTFGGSISHADATAELPLLSVTFGAEIEVLGPDGPRRIGAAEFFIGPFATGLGAEEIVVGATFPRPPEGTASAFEEFAERAGDFALASACAALARDGDGSCSWARLGLGAVAGRPIRAHAAEAILLGSRLDDRAVAAAAAAAMAESSAGGDQHASAGFRRELVGVLVERALARASAAS